MSRQSLLGLALCLYIHCGNTTQHENIETIQEPTEPLVVINNGSWVQLQFVIIYAANTTEAITPSLNYKQSCTPNIDNAPSFPFDIYYSNNSYCPIELYKKQRSEGMQCERLVLSLQGKPELNNEVIGLCIYIGNSHFPENKPEHFNISVEDRTTTSISPTSTTASKSPLHTSLPAPTVCTLAPELLTGIQTTSGESHTLAIVTVCVQVATLLLLIVYICTWKFTKPNIVYPKDNSQTKLPTVPPTADSSQNKLPTVPPTADSSKPPNNNQYGAPTEDSLDPRQCPPKGPLSD